MKFFLLAVALTIPLHITFAEELSRDRQAILELSHLAAPPLVVASDRLSRSSNIHSLFFDALPYEGKATKTFAWLGMPEKKERHDKVPGIILVHGGGGTAFKEWVERWNDQGFAAMSIAVEGQTD